MSIQRKHAIEHLKNKKRLEELERAKNDLYFLACKLGYAWDPNAQQGVTPEFHKPLCQRYDKKRDHPALGTMLQRGGLKSTVFTICLHVQEVLRNPDITGIVFHAVERQAIDIVNEVGSLFWSNDWLRSLDPIGIYPPGTRKGGKDVSGKWFNVCPKHSGVGSQRKRNWLTAGGFRVLRPGKNPTTKRQPTLVGKGSGGETTGVHVDIIYLDDIIGEKTLEDATGMAKIRSWYATTTENVLNPRGRIRMVGTRYDDNDIYSDFIKSKEWDIVVRHALEGPNGEIVHVKGDFPYGGDPTHYGPGVVDERGRVIVPGGKEAAVKREHQKFFRMGSPSIYAAQRMNDTSPQTEKPWQRDKCEHFIPLRASDRKDVDVSGPGIVLVLSDPAPWLAGGYKSLNERERRDGTKDYWSICAVKLRWRGERREAILLDGARSQEWTQVTGPDAIVAMMRKYGTNLYISEDPKTWYEPIRDACVRAGYPMPREGDGGGPFRFDEYNKADAKNQRITGIGSLAASKLFYICEDTCPGSFLYGDERFTGFLTQIRNFRPLPGGRNNLRFDDDVDVVARLNDSRCWRFLPQNYNTVAEMMWRQDDDDDDFPQRSRYCAA